MRLILAFFITCFFLSDPCRAHVLIKALLHTDDHIVWHHNSLGYFLDSQLFNFVPPDQEVNIEPSVPDFLQAWKSALTKTLHKNTKEDLYIVMSSHGMIGRVSFNKSHIQLDDVAEELGTALRSSEDAGFIRNVILFFQLAIRDL